MEAGRGQTSTAADHWGSNVNKSLEIIIVNTISFIYFNFMVFIVIVTTKLSLLMLSFNVVSALLTFSSEQQQTQHSKNNKK